MSKHKYNLQLGAFNPNATPDGTNIFGGLNPNGLYVPLSEDEQEVLQRLIETDDLEVVAHGWGILHQPSVIAGDHRVGIMFRIDFQGSTLSRPLRYLDLELRTRAGMSIFREKKAIPPIMVNGATSVEFKWDIALHSMDPLLVKALKPGTKGLTSRRQDPDTKEITSEGNMSLNSTQKKMLHILDETSKRIRQTDAQSLAKAVGK